LNFDRNHMAEKTNLFEYTEESIKSLDWREHIRLRPGMYIGKLGDGSSPDDGIYVLIKEVIDNCIDEHTMGYGKQVELTIDQKSVTIRDYGRGIPLGKVVDVVSKINTGAKYDSKAFQKSVGLNGVGTKAVNALSQYFKVTAFREGKEKSAEFAKGVLTKEYKEAKSGESNGTLVTFTPDETVFKHFSFKHEYLENQIWNYCYLNAGLIINFNDSPDLGQSFHIRRIAKSFKEVFHLQLHGWSGADMVNLHAADGRCLRHIEEKRRPIAPRAQRSAMATGCGSRLETKL